MSLFAGSLLFFYTVGVVLVLGGYFLYLQLVSLRWEESEIRSLDTLELHLSQVLRLLEAPDVKMLLKDVKSRQRLFLAFSSDLWEDVWELARSRKLEPADTLFAVLFLAICSVMRMKARLFCGMNDLRFLSGLELTLLRRTEGF